jgi:hypothetical protein
MEMDDERSRGATEYAVSGAGNERALIGAWLRLLAGRSRSVLLVFNTFNKSISPFARYEGAQD